ncbi:MAG: hypothetical protein HOF42_03945 [Candidatus Marinimicrobia bacterium]|nr:hypothetical protein [Candidatus Neomarinimicrobiota bacterium]
MTIGLLLTLFAIYLTNPTWEYAFGMFLIGVYVFTRSLDVQEGTYKTALKSSTPVAIGWGILTVGVFIVFLLEIFDKL